MYKVMLIRSDNDMDVWTLRTDAEAQQQAKGLAGIHHGRLVKANRGEYLVYAKGYSAE